MGVPCSRREEGGRRYRARRDQILDSAVAAFRRNGYAGTSTEDIGRALQVTKGSLYYYFRDKEDILFRCHERSLDHLLAAARAVRRRRLAPEAALRELIERHVAIMAREFQGTALALEVGHLTGPRLEQVIKRRDEYQRILREVLEEGARSGAFRPADVKLVSFAILGAVNWMARWYREGGGSGADAIGRAFSDLFAQALRRPGSRTIRPRRPRRKT